MAISHIPRSVGHNFAPEYQISAVPYIVDIASSVTTKYIIFKDDDNTIVGTADAADGLVTTNGRALDTEIFTDSNGDGTIQDNEKTADNLGVGFERVLVNKIELPKISQWIQFIPAPVNNNGIIVGFSNTDIKKGNTIHFSDNSFTETFRIRCTNLYFTGAGINGKLLVGLTAIDRSEFTEVVETFLGD